VNAVYVPSQRVLDLNLEIKRRNRFRLRGTIAAAPVFVLIALFTGRDAAWTGSLVVPCGHLLIAAALALRLWALGSIDGLKKRTLVTWGPYRYVRHPLYCGSLLFVLGTCLVAGSLTAGLMLCLAFLAFHLPALHTEEQFLAARFGAEWDVYRRQTRMLLPRIGARPPRVEKAFHLRRPVREIAALLFLPAVAYGTAALVHYVDRLYQLPDWFF
jgi:protein-S-isoprenylcysteine O-methyltransferase Ste14